MKRAKLYCVILLAFVLMLTACGNQGVGSYVEGVLDGILYSKRDTNFESDLNTENDHSSSESGYAGSYTVDFAGHSYDLMRPKKEVFSSMVKDGLYLTNIFSSFFTFYNEDGEYDPESRLPSDEMEDFYDKNENKILGIQENHKMDYRNKVDYFDYAIFDDLRGKAPYLTMDGISEESMPLQLEKLGYVNTGRYGKRSHNGDLVYTKIFEDGVYVDVSQYADEFEKMEDEGFGSWAKFLPENTDGLVGFCRYGTFAEGDVPTSAYNATVHSQAELFEDFYNYCLVSLALTDCSRRMDRGKTKTVVVVTVEFWDDPNDGMTEQFANWQVYTAK